MALTGGEREELVGVEGEEEEPMATATAHIPDRMLRMALPISPTCFSIDPLRPQPRGSVLGSRTSLLPRFLTR